MAAVKNKKAAAPASVQALALASISKGLKRLQTADRKAGNEVSVVLTQASAESVAADRSREYPTLNHSISLVIRRTSLPRGGIVMLHGAGASGKTTYALQMCAHVQQEGGLAIYVDGECKLDLGYAQRLGVNVGDLVLLRPRTIQGAYRGLVLSLAAWRTALEQNGMAHDALPVVVVWDSYQSVGSEKADVDNLQGVAYGGDARDYSQMLRQIKFHIWYYGALFLGIDQVRASMEQPSRFSAPKDKFGVGNAPFHASLVVLVFEETSKIKKGPIQIGNAIRITGKKVQVGPNGGSANAINLSGHGLNPVYGLEQAMLATGIAKVEKRNGRNVTVFVSNLTGEEVTWREWSDLSEILASQEGLAEEMDSLVSVILDSPNVLDYLVANAEGTDAPVTAGADAPTPIAEALDVAAANSADEAAFDGVELDMGT